LTAADYPLHVQFTQLRDLPLTLPYHPVSISVPLPSPSPSNISMTPAHPRWSLAAAPLHPLVILPSSPWLIGYTLVIPPLVPALLLLMVPSAIARKFNVLPVALGVTKCPDVPCLPNTLYSHTSCRLILAMPTVPPQHGKLSTQLRPSPASCPPLLPTRLTLLAPVDLVLSPAV
jgi:hypothetical protein